MANVVEIVLRSRDNATLGIRGAKKELDAFVASTVKSGDYTVVAGKKMTQSYGDAHRAATLLGQQIGVTLPQAISTFLAKSQTIGPILNSAFSALAAVGLLQVISQLPAAIDKAAGALTGWNDAAKKAYAEQIALNEKYVDRLKSTQAELEKMAIAAQRTAVATAEAARFPEGQVPARFGAYAALGRLLGFGNEPGQAAQSAQERAGAAALAASANMGKPELSQMSQALQGVIEQQDKLRESARQARLETEALYRALGFVRPGEGGIGGTLGFRGLLGQPSAPMGVGGLSPIAGIDFEASVTAARKSTEAALAQSREFANRQAEIRADAELDASKMIFDKQQEQAMRLGQILNDSLGAAWDNMFIRGRSVLASLANFAAGIGNAIGRTFFQAAGGAILSRVPGVGRLAGLASGIGMAGLSGGFAGAATLGSSTVAGLASGPVLGFGLAASPAPMILGGLGAGAPAAASASFLGMGLTTAIPVVGGIVGAALLAFHFLRRRTAEAPFSQDPNAIERNRTYFFHTATEVNQELIRLLKGVNTMPPGVLVSDGLPMALNSSNTFRRDMAGVLMDDT